MSKHEHRVHGTHVVRGVEGGEGRDWVVEHTSLGLTNGSHYSYCVLIINPNLLSVLVVGSVTAG